MKPSSTIYCAGLLAILAFVYADRRSAVKQIQTLQIEVHQLREKQRATAVSVRLPYRIEKNVATMAPVVSRTLSNTEVATPVLDGAQRVSRTAFSNLVTSATASPIDDYASVYDGMELVFVGEQLDNSWAREAKTLIDNSFTERLPIGSRIAKVECRSTICRVESTHDNVMRTDEFVRNTMGEPSARPWNGSFSTGPIALDTVTGRVTAVTYMIREGHVLPEIDYLEEALN